MDVALNENEGACGEIIKPPPASITLLEDLAQRLTLETFTISKQSPSHKNISNTTIDAVPDLRYPVQVPFLHQPGLGDKLEQAALAFTSAATSHLGAGKTVFFEFFKPVSPSLATILDFYRSQMSSKSDEYAGALLDASHHHFISPTEHQADNLPQIHGREPYRIYIVILDRPDFADTPRSVTFQLADGGKLKSSIEQQSFALGLRSETGNFVEMEVRRAAGL